MLVVCAFCNKDAAAAEKLLRWMAELGTYERHQLLLVASATIDPSKLACVSSEGRQTFTTTTVVKALRKDERPWPYAPNTMFRCAVGFVKSHLKVPFWWNEPDCIPLSTGWLDMLEDEYIKVGKPFMGSVVTKPCQHLTGCAIYPADPGLYNRAMMMAEGIAFDCVNPQDTLRHTHHTRLFHHQWSDPKGADVPTFQDEKSLSIISRNAVVFHRNKDHTLIDRLREQRAIRHNVVVEVSGASHEDAFGVPFSAPESRLIVTDISGMSTEELPESQETEAWRKEVTGEIPAGSVPVFTYYDPIPGNKDPKELIELWKELWSAQGWKPVVLGVKDAMDCLQYKPFRSKIAQLPTVNHPIYERACYLRHLAMVNVGGGLLTDYDVMPRKFTPVEAREVSEDRGLTLLEPTRVPCAVKASKAGFQRIVDYISNYKISVEDMHMGKPHTSDMEILRKTKWKAVDSCVEHLCSGSQTRDELGDGWKKAPCIHFSTYSFHKLGLNGKAPKHELIKSVLATLPPL